MIVHMNTSNDPRNARLRQLLEDARLTQAEALTLFNRGMVKPISLSGWKAWLADRESDRWRVLHDDYLKHAEKVFAKLANKA